MKVPPNYDELVTRAAHALCAYERLGDEEQKPCKQCRPADVEGYGMCIPMCLVIAKGKVKVVADSIRDSCWTLQPENPFATLGRMAPPKVESQNG